MEKFRTSSVVGDLYGSYRHDRCVRFKTRPVGSMRSDFGVT